MSDLLIKNGSVVFETGVQKVDIVIRGGKIAGFYAPGQAPDTNEILDAAGLHIMPGSIDPHTHWGIYKPYERDVEEDSRRALIGGLTTVMQFHRHNNDYFETVPEFINLCDRKSSVDYTFSLGLIKKLQVENLDKYIKELHINSFKFYLDKTNKLEAHYGLTPGTGFLGNKREVLDILLKMKSIDPDAVLCLHCEDTEIFYPEQERVFQDTSLDQFALSTYNAARPDFNEVSAVLSVLWMNHIADGNIYIVHNSTGDAVKMTRALKPMLKGRVSLETCPHYLVLTDESPCGLKGTVVPPIRKQYDSDELWKGIADGTVDSMGTDNCPCDIKDKYKNGSNIKLIIPGFPGAGIILPSLITEGHLKRGISLSQLSKVNSINAARKFGLKNKGEMKVGFDADLALIDLNWERTIGSDEPELYGGCDFSIYEGMSFKGWPRYTLLRGEIMQKDGVILNGPKGKFLPR